MNDRKGTTSSRQTTARDDRRPHPTARTRRVLLALAAVFLLGATAWLTPILSKGPVDTGPLTAGADPDEGAASLGAATATLGPGEETLRIESPLVVNSPSRLDEARETYGWTGAGTAADPIVIPPTQIVTRERPALTISDLPHAFALDGVTVTGPNDEHDTPLGKGTGILVRHVEAVRVTNSQFLGLGNGLEVRATKWLEVRNSTFDSNRFALIGDGIAGIIAGNTFTHNHQSIRLTGAAPAMPEPGMARQIGAIMASVPVPSPTTDVHRIVVHENTILGPRVESSVGSDGASETAAAIGILVKAPGVAIVDNRLEDHSASAIRVEDHAATLVGNIIHQSGGRAIQLSDTHDVRVHGNQLEGDPDLAISIVGGEGTHLTNNTVTAPLARVAAPGEGDTSAGGDRATTKDPSNGTKTRLVFAEETAGLRIQTNLLTGGARGIVLLGPTGAIVEGNQIQSSVQAIDVHEGKDTTIQGNLITTPLRSGIDLFGGRDIRVMENELRASGSFGIFASKDAHELQVHSNAITATPFAISVVDGVRASSVADNVIVGPTRTGIGLSDTQSMTLSGNQIRGADQGIQLYGNNRGTHIQGGVVNLNVWGIVVAASNRDALLEGPSILQNQVGVYITGHHGHEIVGADIRQNSQGVLLLDASNVTIHASHILGNRLGMHLSNATDNLVYDNVILNDHLPSDRNVLLDASDGNQWNIDRTPGTNVAGGDIIAGNLWHDYTGADADQDGIGDVPHRPNRLIVETPEGVHLDARGTMGGADAIDLLPLVAEVPRNNDDPEGLQRPRPAPDPSNPDGRPKHGPVA